MHAVQEDVAAAGWGGVGLFAEGAPTAEAEAELREEWRAIEEEEEKEGEGREGVARWAGAVSGNIWFEEEIGENAEER